MRLRLKPQLFPVSRDHNIFINFDEVLAAVAPNQQGHKIFSNPMDVVRMSRSLVALDQSSEEFRFAHLSVREFIEQHPDFSIEICQYGAA